MPRLLQGDIFTTATAQSSDLTVVFGSIEFNLMNMYWREFARTVASLRQIRDPFSDLSSQPYEYAHGRWLWFIGVRHDDGLTDSGVGEVLEAAFSWAHLNGLKTIITNGTSDKGNAGNPTEKQKSNDRRARFLIASTTDCERRFGLDITLVSLNHVFTRNAPDHSVNNRPP